MEKELTKCSENNSVKQVLKRKGWALLFMLGVAVGGTAIIYKYFYFLDAFFYTCEFYWLFNVNNLQAANTTMFVDFFSPMAVATEALPQIVFSHLVQNFYLIFTKPILTSAATSAFGLGLGSLFSFLAFLVVGLLSFGLGTFFLGDILPYNMKRNGRLQKYQKIIATPAAIFFPILFAIPFVPISVVAISGAALKVSLRQVNQFMLMGFTLRLSWLLTMPFLFS